MSAPVCVTPSFDQGRSPERTAPICVVTPSFNQGRFLERTVRSVLDQGVGGLDYLVVDGGSSDHSLEVLDRYDGRLRFVSEPDRGQAHAVNKALRATSAPIIGWINSDDVYLPGALDTVCRFFDSRPEVDVVYGTAFHIDEDDRFLDAYPTEAWRPDRLRETCFLCQPAVFFRRRVIEDHGLLDERLHYCLDYEYWLRLSLGGARFRHLPRPLAGSRLHPEAKTLDRRVAGHAETNSMLRRHLGRAPSRWLANWATEVLAHWGVSPRDRRRYVPALAIVSLAASLRWNRSVPASLRKMIREWLRHARDAGPAPPRPAGRKRCAASGPRSSLTIGFDVSQTGPRRAGCGTMAAATIEALSRLDGDHRYLLYASFGDHFWEPLGPQATLELEHPRFERALVLDSPAQAEALWQLPGEELERALGCPDVVHANNFYCPTNLRRARLVYTLHDLGFLVDPRWTGEENRQACYDGVWNASLCADAVVAVSRVSRDHFLATFPHYPEGRVAVARLGCRFPARSGVEPSLDERFGAGRFFLHVGSPEPRKNQQRLFRAYRRYAARVTDPLPLVWAGGATADAVPSRLSGGCPRPMGLPSAGPGSIVSLGYVDDASLLGLYQTCRAVLLPSLWEGFGLPVIEAMSQGAAVLASDRGVLREVAGDGAWFVDPLDERSIERGLERLASDGELCARLRREGPPRARQFTWQRTAEAVLEVYRAVVLRPKLDLPAELDAGGRGSVG